MKAVTLFLITWPFFVAAQDTIFYDSGAIKAMGELNENSKKDGTWTYFYPSGSLSAEISFRNGKQHGTQRAYGFEGNLLSVENWTHDALSDSAFYYHPNGQLKRKGVYRNALYQGVWIFYDENGHLEQEGNYEAGLPSGLWLTYAENGQILQEGEYKNGQASGWWRFYNEEGDPTYEGQFEEDERVGQWYRFTRSGKKKKWKNYESGD